MRRPRGREWAMLDRAAWRRNIKHTEVSHRLMRVAMHMQLLKLPICQAVKCARNCLTSDHARTWLTAARTPVLPHFVVLAMDRRSATPLIQGYTCTHVIPWKRSVDIRWVRNLNFVWALEIRVGSLIGAPCEVAYILVCLRSACLFTSVNIVLPSPRPAPVTFIPADAFGSCMHA